MRISFNLEIGNPITEIRQWYRKYQCFRKGHVWKKYEDQCSLYDIGSFIYTFGEEPIAVCSRCRELKLKKRVYVESITFSRYKSKKKVRGR